MSTNAAVKLTDARRTGITSGFGAYILWGFLPLYFLLLSPTGPIEIVASRILFSLVFCALTITITKRWQPVVVILRQRRLTLTLGIAALLIFVNWQVYVFASVTGHIIEASLGYFMNPIVTILLGVIVLRERLHVVQWIAVGISVVAVVVLSINYGAFPWISVTLALSFGLYGFVKNRTGGRVDALSGLTIETAWLVPVAIIELIVVAAQGALAAGTGGPLHIVELAGTGVVTAIPLLLFAAAARRLPLVTIGFIQFVTPILQFLIGAFLLHESLTPVRWFGFSLVWLSLAILSGHLLWRGRVAKRVVIVT